MLTLYVICLLVGLVFTVVSFIFSGAFESHVDAGADVGVDMGGDAHGDISGGDAGVGEIHFPFLSPVVIATFVTAFGAGGLVGLKFLGFLEGLSVLVALGTALLVAFLVGLLVMKMYQVLESNAVTTAQSLVGHQAEVTEPILAAGVGEISFSGKSSRITGPARSEENRNIKRHALVTITRVVGGLYYVREHVDEKLRDIAAQGPETATAEPKKES
jgi:hypothetical protein